MSRWEVREGDCREVMAAMEPESVDAIVTDPPYGLSFMGKGWDHGVPGVEFWEAAMRVAKPGAHLLAFGGTRTFHRLTCAIEDAGFEIRDQVVWLYGQGFPKSHNLDGAWHGWGTALKPAWEPIILARKPFKGTVAANVVRYGTGALNVDGCRIGVEQRFNPPTKSENAYGGFEMCDGTGTTVSGRWPANVALDENAAAMLDAESDIHGAGPVKPPGGWESSGGFGGFAGAGEFGGARIGDTGGASRFFYTSKASRGEREAGLEGTEHMVRRYSEQGQGPLAQQTPRTARAARNHHPTVKPLDLMCWLVRLVTPPGGLVLDPFAGSGTTVIAALRQGFRAIGIEREADYCVLARRRIAEDAPLLNRGGD